MVYKRYIKKRGKTFGPYYYESYRDENGKTHTRFLGGPEYGKKTRAITNTKSNKFNWTILIISIFLSIFLLGTFFISNQQNSDKLPPVIRQINSQVNFFQNNLYSFITSFVSEGEDLDEEEEPPEESETEEQIEEEIGQEEESGGGK